MQLSKGIKKERIIAFFRYVKENIFVANCNIKCDKILITNLYV